VEFRETGLVFFDARQQLLLLFPFCLDQIRSVPHFFELLRIAAKSLRQSNTNTVAILSQQRFE
jgi:hypothetical protein